MTPAQFKEARLALGLSQSQMAALVQVKNARTIRKWESGESEISGPAIVALRYILRDAGLDNSVGGS